MAKSSKKHAASESAGESAVESDDELPSAAHAGHDHAHHNLPLLILGALGVVYGDIGTSPLYALRESFHSSHSVALNVTNVLGVLSLIVWSLTLVIVVKYLTFILRADNRGEGGVLALLALLLHQPDAPHKVPKRYFILLGVFGASLLYGEGIITPAISVLSAVEGLEVATERFASFVVPITVVILFGLFMVQKGGTAKMGNVFGPITLIWFIMLAILGVRGIMQHPSVLFALNPWYAVKFFMANGMTGYFVLGAVVLAITGAEALYADMGHFGRRPIRIGWFFVVFPALLLNYFGQGAVLLTNPAAVEHPFYALVPRGMLYPMVGLAMAATIIASQALISGSFSLTQQAIQLGFLPRLRIVHTSARRVGQIYIPEVNTVLMIGCIALVLAFRSSSALAAAYGLAVVGTMAIGTLLFSTVARRRWNWSWRRIIPFAAFFLAIEMAFLGANAVKLAQGAWLPLVIGVILLTIMSTWERGRAMLARHFARGALPLEMFVDELERHPPARVNGTAVFLTANPDGVPPVLLHHLKHNKVLHERVVLLSILTLDYPHVPDNERVSVDSFGAGMYRLQARYGFMESPDVPQLVKSAVSRGLKLKMMETTFYLGRDTLVTRSHAGMMKWRKRLFSLMQRNAQPATAFFNIPPNRVVELGAQIEL